ncbi:MAG: hypothetical protein B7Y41_06745 [Hydrogenophilales bacterium 28-61-23]|nr:MAG: hypothetical protein B7Y41_06745 [Hydrogenophilales bacterium 28-61-23]
MSTTWLITNFIAAFLLPPLSLIILGLLGLGLLKRRRNLGQTLIASSLISIVLLSTPIVAGFLLDSLKPAPVAFTGKEADAIVILGGGRISDSVEFGGDTLGRFTLERVRYGAWLARKLHKPLLVTGGAPDGGIPEGEMMRASLDREFGIKDVRWVEAASNNTRENARYSARLLKDSGIDRIYLVTHAWHLARAIPEFEALGLRVIPAGTGYSLSVPAIPLDFLPNAKALQDSTLATHEWIGLLWYRIRT